MTEELYEELPADDIEEELYEDLPDSAYEAAKQYPFPTPTSPSYNTGGAPPPLPTGPIPQHRPGMSPPPSQSPAPPLPTRSPTTTVSTSQTLPSPRRQDRSKPPPKKKAGPPPKAPVRGGGGGGIDMKEILQKARTGDRVHALELLENKNKAKDEDGEKIAPWANQLRKTAPPKPKEEATNTSAPVPWTKRNSQIDMQEQVDDTPEFIKKARTMSRSEADTSPTASPKPGDKPPPTAAKPPPSPKPPTAGPKPAAKPPPVAKPRNMNPEGFQPKVANTSDTSDKPAWLKQRERQLNLAKGDQDNDRPPSPATKPPPSVPNGTVSPPPVQKKPPPPKPAPRKNEPPPPISTKPTNEAVTQESSPAFPSVRERAQTLERGAKQRIPTPPESPVLPVPPRGSASPPNQPSPRLPPKPRSPPPEEPVVPNHSPPSTRPPPPLTAPPPSSEQTITPPLPDRAPPTRPPPTFTPPPPPDEAPVPPLPDRPPPSKRPPTAPPRESTLSPQTIGEPTPPTETVMMYRRRPLPTVDLFSPPPRPPVNTKPLPELGEDEEIYDDTVAFMEDQNGETDELYDDVTQLNASPPKPLPPATPPPGPPSTAPPPLPVGLPPSSRPSVTTLGSDEVQVNGSGTPNGDIPDEQETYEDLESAAEAYATAQSTLLSAGPTSTASLVPPSPQHSVASAGNSPTMNRKLTKEEKKQQEKKERERKKLEKEKEKERKKREEARMKNKIKGLKAFKQFELKPEVEPLFAVEILLEHGKTKDHLNVTEGEVARVLLINHPKLPIDRYLIEKEDGTIGFLKKNICQRTAYQSAASVLDVPPQPVAQAFQDDQDIYESLPQGDEGDFPDALQGSLPSLPPPNPGTRFPPPSQPAPPPPIDGPEDNYEYLPEPQD